MSGHSKWATIRRAKGANDAKRGAMFTKLGHEIALAAREGGPDPDSNFRLRIILDKARSANMPKDNIERAIKRGAGDGGEGGGLEEHIYEGYGPNGSAIILQTLTDNRNRTVAEVRHVFSRFGGNLGADGCVAWMFERKGVILINAQDEDPDEIMLVAIDAGADDVQVSDDEIEITTALQDFKVVLDTLSEASYAIESSSIEWVPNSRIDMSEAETIRNLKLVEALEDLDDVQEVFSNLNISDEVMDKYQAA
ncbi:MAG: YebC/PmpR family DNA-binding transcriptional regulator [Anaerolineae bacterium]|jgi:YebC/PmpR family DNA-binding regulatory protein